MNNLNKCSERETTHVPDILRNLNVKEDVNEKGYHKEHIDDAIEKKPLNVDTTQSTEDQPDLSQIEENRRKSRKLKKGACLLGWILCCPVFCVWNTLRESPVDDEDWKDDYCYPCVS